MGRHLSNYDLFACGLPEVIYTKTALWIMRVSTGFNVPIRGVALSLPVEIELISAAMRIPHAILDRLVAQCPFTNPHSSFATSGGKPNKTTCGLLHIFKYRVFDHPTGGGGQCQSARQLRIAPVGKLAPGRRERQCRVGGTTLVGNLVKKLANSKASSTQLLLGTFSPEFRLLMLGGEKLKCSMVVVSLLLKRFNAGIRSCQLLRIICPFANKLCLAKLKAGVSDRRKRQNVSPQLGASDTLLCRQRPHPAITLRCSILFQQVFRKEQTM